MPQASDVRPFAFDRTFAAPERTSPLRVEDVRQKLYDTELELAELKRRIADQDEELARVRREAFEAGAATERANREEDLRTLTGSLLDQLTRVDEAIGEAADRIGARAATVAQVAAEVIAGRAIERDPAGTIDEAIGRALQQAGRGEELRIHVHPSMAEQIESRIETRQSRDRRRLNLVVVPDSKLQPQDARIDWEQGELLLSSETRAAAVRKEFETIFASGGK